MSLDLCVLLISKSTLYFPKKEAERLIYPMSVKQGCERILNSAQPNEWEGPLRALSSLMT